MSKKLVRQILALVILAATVAAFIVYFINHPETFRSLKSVSIGTLILLFALYAAFIGSLAWIQQATLRLCNIDLGAKESTLLMMYSSIINFFGPLQSGPAFRAAYLKKKHNVSLKKYTLATLVYYGLYAAFSGLLLISFLAGWWIAVVVVALLVCAPLALRYVPRFRSLDVRGLRSLALATLAQSLIQSAIYFVALHTLLPHVSYIQALIYTGAANFALFVSITPGAIGFRESFLLVTQQLHGISGSVIAAASVIDRGVYIILLLIMAAFIFGFHANDHLRKQAGLKKS